MGVFGLTDIYSAATVAAALITKDGNLYTGVCLDLACGIGFCAEHSAVADMLKNRETEIDMVVAVDRKGIIPPCGRCRELMMQVNLNNKDCAVLMPGGKAMKLKELLPEHWMEYFCR